MPKQRRLGDLYVVGKELTLDDGKGPVTVWINKLNPVDHSNALRHANAARARILAAKKDKESEERLSIESDLADQEKEDLITFLVSDVALRRQEAIEAELAAEQEWEDKDYLQGLVDSWENGLKDTYAADSEDPEAKHVFEELERWEAVLAERMKAEREALTRDYSEKSEEDLRELTLDRLIQVQGDQAWLEEYHRCEVWLATREPDHHKKKYFANRDEVDDLPNEVLLALVSAYRELTVEPTEGKDSPGTPASSASSESIETETSPDSGRQDVTV